jgi:parallel beta helix pectate lyase-like protein
MKRNNEVSLTRLLIGAASITIATMFSVPVLAQQKAVVVASPDVTSVRPLSIISRSGSYVLNRNVVNNSRAGADSVQVTASDVVLDLSGFTIACTGSNTGAGINAATVSNVVIRDGVIQGCGGPAVITGANSNISGLTVSGNSTTASVGAAIQAGAGSVISSNIVTDSGATNGGVSCGSGTGCLVRDNVIQGNGGVGITLSDATGGYRSNVLQGNSGITTPGTSGQVSGGTSLEQNLCNGSTC